MWHPPQKKTNKKNPKTIQKTEATIKNEGHCLLVYTTWECFNLSLKFSAYFFFN